VAWPTTRATELLGIRYPIVQAPMAGSTTPARNALADRLAGVEPLPFPLQAVATGPVTRAALEQGRETSPSSSPDRARRAAVRSAPPSWSRRSCRRPTRSWPP
jgi:NAD(P)H-dependent flavin oxidoreductase YrpB (nitropropane dioxygenase family)